MQHCSVESDTNVANNELYRKWTNFVWMCVTEAFGALSWKPNNNIDLQKDSHIENSYTMFVTS
jgi:hypothetical protein